MKKILLVIFASLILSGCNRPSEKIEPVEPTVNPSTPTPEPLNHIDYDSQYVIINKTHPLTETYEPSDLVVPNVAATKEGLQLRKMQQTLLKLCLMPLKKKVLYLN